MLDEQARQEVLEYVSHVGTPFAVAMYRSRFREFTQKADQVIAVRNRLAKALEAHFESDKSPLSKGRPLLGGDESCFHAAFGTYSEYFSAQATEWKQREEEAIRLNLPGTNPGRQEHLDRNGIQIDLAAIEAELYGPGIDD